MKTPTKEQINHIRHAVQDAVQDAVWSELEGYTTSFIR